MRILTLLDLPQCGAPVAVRSASSCPSPAPDPGPTAFCRGPGQLQALLEAELVGCLLLGPSAFPTLTLSLGKSCIPALLQSRAWSRASHTLPGVDAVSWLLLAPGPGPALLGTTGVSWPLRYSAVLGAGTHVLLIWFWVLHPTLCTSFLPPSLGAPRQLGLALRATWILSG